MANQRLPLSCSFRVVPPVIRAKVVGEQEVNSGNDIYGNPIKRIQYEVKQVKVRSPRPDSPGFSAALL